MMPSSAWDAPWGPPAEPMPAPKFLVHVHRTKCGAPLRGGLALGLSAYYLLLTLSVRDWWAWGQSYGLPTRVGRYPGTASDDDIQTLVSAVASLASDAGAVIPDSMQLELVQASRSSSGDGLYRDQAAWCESECSKAVVGQTMTADDGSSRAQAEAHDDVRQDLVADDARQIADSLSRLAAWYCELNHAPRPAGWPRVEYRPPEADIDLEAVETAGRAGVPVGADWLRDRLGIPAAAEGDDVLSWSAPTDGPALQATGPPPRRRRRRRRRRPALNADDGDRGADQSPAEDRAAAARRAADDALLAGVDWFAASAAATAPLRVAAASAAAPADLLDALAAPPADELVESLALRTFQARVEAALGDGAAVALGAEIDADGRGVVPRGAVRWLRTKGERTSGPWTDVWREEHAASFTAAWMTADDQVRATHRALTRALRDGETMETFRARLQPELERLGWAPPARGGSVPARLERIYHTNMRTSRAAGDWDRFQRQRDLRPFLVYELGPSTVHRDSHLAWAGTTLPLDDPWWNRHATPNGWGCKCWLRAVTRAEADERLREQPARGRPAAPPRQPWPPGRQGRRGRRYTPGIDPGWDYNPGAHRTLGVNRAMTGRFEALVTGERAEAADLAPAARLDLVRRRLRGWVEGPAFRWFRDRPRAADPPARDRVSAGPVEATAVETTPAGLMPEAALRSIVDQVRAAASAGRRRINRAWERTLGRGDFLIRLPEPAADHVWRRHGPGAPVAARPSVPPEAWWADLEPLIAGAPPPAFSNGYWLVDFTDAVGRRGRLVLNCDEAGIVIVTLYRVG